MKKYISFLFFIIFNCLSIAQKPSYAYIPSDMQSVASGRWTHWVQKMPAEAWGRLGWVDYALQSLHISQWSNRSLAEVQSVLTNPTMAGIDTSGFWHLASKRDSLGATHYLLVLPMRSMAIWKNFIEQSLPRFNQSEFKIQNGHFYIQRENMAWVWNRDRIMIWWYLLPLGVQYKPTFAQYKAFALLNLNDLLKISDADGLHRQASFSQALDKPADLYWWANWGGSLASAMQFKFERGRVQATHQLTLPAAATAMLNNPPAWDSRHVAAAWSSPNGGLQWAFRFAPTSTQNLKYMMQWLALTPYFKGFSSTESPILASKAVQNAWLALQGSAVGQFTHFVLQSDSTVLPAFEWHIAHRNSTQVKIGLLELVNNGILILSDKNKLVFEYKYSSTWSWFIKLNKKTIHITMNDQKIPIYSSSKQNHTFPVEALQFVALDGNSFFANWSAILPVQHRLQPVLHTLKAAVDSYKLSSQTIENQQLHQTWELVLVNREADTWAQFLQLGNLFVLPSQ